MKFTKEIVRPGKYVVNVPTKDSSGKVTMVRKEQEITKNRIKHWADQFAEMNKAGLKVPAPFRHDLSSLPLTDAQRIEAEKTHKEAGSLSNAGYWENLFYDANGTLHGIIDVADDLKDQGGNLIVERMGKSFKECSLMSLPEFLDGNGKKWEDGILHVAIVTNPIVPGQANFEPINDVAEPALALALSQFVPDDEIRPTITELSLNENLIDGTVYFSGRFKKSPSTLDFVEKFKTYIAAASKGENIYLNSSVAMSLFPEIQPSVTGCLLATESGEAISLGNLVSALVKIGFVLPDGTTEKNFMDRLLTACTTLTGLGKSLASDVGGNGLTIVPGGLAMSHTFKADSPEGKLVARQQRDLLTTRIQGLIDTGRIQAPYVKEVLQPMLEGAALSLSIDDDGNMGPTSLEPVLVALERLPATIVGNGSKINGDKATNKIGALTLSLEDAAPDSVTQLDDAGAESVVATIFKNVGHPVAAK